VLPRACTAPRCARRTAAHAPAAQRAVGSARGGLRARGLRVWARCAGAARTANRPTRDAAASGAAHRAWGHRRESQAAVGPGARPRARGQGRTRGRRAPRGRTTRGLAEKQKDPPRGKARHLTLNQAVVSSAAICRLVGGHRAAARCQRTPDHCQSARRVHPPPRHARGQRSRPRTSLRPEGRTAPLMAAPAVPPAHLRRRDGPVGAIHGWLAGGAAGARAGAHAPRLCVGSCTEGGVRIEA